MARAGPARQAPQALELVPLAGAIRFLPSTSLRYTSSSGELPRTLALACAWLLLLIAGYAVGRLVTDGLPGWDLTVGEALRGRDDSALTQLMRRITTVGAPVVLDAVFVAAVAVLLLRRRFGDLGFLILASPGAVLLEQLLKRLVDRPRPAGEHLVVVHSPSWPSGHASSSLALYGALLLLAVARGADNARGGRRFARTIVIAGSVGLLAMIGLSRVYLGVHYPSDVLAGWLLSGSWLAILTLILLRRMGAPRSRSAHADAQPTASGDPVD